MQMTRGGLDEKNTADLLSSVAEQLKVPLTIIARQAEVSQLVDPAAAQQGIMRDVRVQADAALNLVDSYLLGLQLLREQGTLLLEPVSVSSMLVDTAHALDRYAKQYDVDLELRIGGKYEPVMAHPLGLRAALLSLGYTLIESQAAQQRTHRHQLSLAAHRTRHGIVAGVYGRYEDVSAAEWRRALTLYGRVQQPFMTLSGGSGAGLFVANTILQAMSARLRVGRYQRQSGLATTLLPSQQLQFV